MPNTRLIKISNNLIFFNPETYIDVSKINLEKGGTRFRTNEDIYFKVEVKSFNKATKALTVKIIDYNPKDISGFKEQKVSAKINYLIFEPVEWKQIEPLLFAYIEGILLREKLIVNNKNETPLRSVSEIPKNRNNYERITAQSSEVTLNANPIVEELPEDFNISYTDAVFGLGFVSFECKSKLLLNKITLRIDNSYILPEFNSIKSYFPKALGGSKKFSVKVKYFFTNKVFTSAVALSSEISRIDETIIASIQKTRILNLTSNPIISQVSKSIFTSDDIIDNFETNLKDDNSLILSEDDILRVLFEAPNIRNLKHLQYLSGSAHSPKQKLRFTLKPLFGFLFFIEGETKNHYCWELLNSHATYLWSFDKLESDIASQYKRIEETINTIRDLKREKYKSSYRANQIDSDLIFSAIEHSNINSDLVDGFVEWRHKLKERLI